MKEDEKEESVFWGVIAIALGAYYVSDYWTSIAYWRQMAEFGHETPIKDGVMFILIGCIWAAWETAKKKKRRPNIRLH